MLVPVGKNILIKGVEANTKGILLPNQKFTLFEIVGVGEEVTKVCVGDKIYLTKYAGTEIEHDAVKYTVIDESNILCKVTL